MKIKRLSTKSKGLLNHIAFAFMIVILIASVLVFAVAEDDEWKLTQYADNSGNQAMFYSLVNEQMGSLILIDGGWTENAEQVKRIIDENGGHVTAWFLTHYHNDHAGAFNELWGEYKDSIEVVYVTPLVWEEFEPKALAWDSPETFSTFLEITKDSEKIKALDRGEQFDISGLTVTVFNSYDDIVRKYGDIANNCSLVFSIKAKEQSILFLGDMYHNALGNEILDMFGAEALHVNFVQSAHHGNNTQSNEFYLAVNPSAIFLDGPEWLMTGETYKAKDFLTWCAENGITTYDYRNAPTTLVFK